MSSTAGYLPRAVSKISRFMVVYKSVGSVIDRSESRTGGTFLQRSDHANRSTIVCILLRHELAVGCCFSCSGDATGALIYFDPCKEFGCTEEVEKFVD